MPNGFILTASIDNSLACGKWLWTTLLYGAGTVTTFAFKFNANTLCHKN
jgi:hypothetical protein